jgi:hypothetical protein
MKIALCFSGLARAIEEAYPYIKQAFLEKYDVDIFAHTWLEDPWFEKSANEIYKKPNTDYNTRVNEVKKIFDIYKPKSFSIDSYHIQQDYCRPSKDAQYQIHTRYCSVIESVYIANELKKKYEQQNNFKYDCVIRCRFDTGFLQTFNFEEYDLSKHIYTQKVDNDVLYHINDSIVFSSSEKMDKWSELHLHIREVADKVVSEITELREKYKNTGGGPDTHDLYACWNRMHNLGAIMIPISTVHRCVDSKVEFY